MTENYTDSKMAVETGKSLKETLYAQQQLLQKLYNELDVEREASSSAASEALAMILRLQGEKASVKMESEHYKRLAEEKMCYAEESMEIFEERIYQKEMEIASLDSQLQAYRYKLSSLGFEDIGPYETSSHESLLRRNSAPPKLLKLAYLKRNRSISPDSDIISKTVEENSGEDESHHNLDLEKQSYWDQIRKLDKIVEEMADDENINLRVKSSSGFSQFNELDQNQSVKKFLDDEIPPDFCSLNVLDVFEVPEVNEIVVNHEKEVQDDGKLILEGEKKVLIFPEEALKSYEKMLVLKQKDKEVFLPRDDIVVDCHMAIGGSSQQVNNRRMEITEGEIEVGNTGKEEVLRLLNEINEKLDLIQFEIKNGNKKTKKLSQNYDLQMLQLTEAMLHFWL